MSSGSFYRAQADRMLRQAEAADQADKIRAQVPDHGVVRFTRVVSGRTLTYAAIRIDTDEPFDSRGNRPQERWYVTSGARMGGFLWEALLRFIGEDQVDTLEILSPVTVAETVQAMTTVKA